MPRGARRASPLNETRDGPQWTELDEGIEGDGSHDWKEGVVPDDHPT